MELGQRVTTEKRQRLTAALISHSPVPLREVEEGGWKEGVLSWLLVFTAFVCYQQTINYINLLMLSIFELTCKESVVWFVGSPLFL